MQTWICEICGDAYLGQERPSECPFCGARHGFIREGKAAQPVTEIKEVLSEKSKKNLAETLALEIKASAIYTCMAGMAKSYEVMKMYKRLAKVELEHAIICTKLMQISLPEIKSEECSMEEIENFQKTIALEEHAASLYEKFASEAAEAHVKKMFIALSQVESDHIVLIKNYLV